ncbi:MAG: hypothetical protein Q607_CBUC00038G0004 [Clostridium butyricum DORA_1]|nr:MAG: hypothetical protein Q607_CBUC00038G0004 [Clostridium butyricum DORA_1]MDU1509964.1 amidophosphoribosyltransferase [Clostridium butyricum]
MNFSILEESNEQTSSNVKTNVEDTLMETYVDEIKETSIEEFLNNSKPVSSKNRSRSYSNCIGAISMVNAKTGMRIVLSAESYEKLGQPNLLQFALTDDELLIGKLLSNNSDKFNVKNYKNKGVIYSASLVKEITEVFSLDYTNRTSITFGEARFITDGVDEPILAVKIR